MVAPKGRENRLVIAPVATTTGGFMHRQQRRYPGEDSAYGYLNGIGACPPRRERVFAVSLTAGKPAR